MSSSNSRRTSAKSGVGWKAAVVLIGLTAVYIYAWTLNAPFLFDDDDNIVENRSIQTLSLSNLFSVPRRGVAYTSFALNYQAHGHWPAGYRVTNVAIHILAGLVLFDLVRLTLKRAGFEDRYQVPAASFSLVLALVWVAHPLQTQAVTYIVQRMESLASLFYLACLWSLARGSGSDRPWPWMVASAAACWLGMATKEIVATLPLVALLYDRIFLAASWQELWRRRWFLYLAYFAALGWVVWQSAVALGLTSGSSTAMTTSTAGAGIHAVSRWEYLCTQAGVILHYLRLAVVPIGQCVDYAWPIAQSPRQWLPAGLVVAALLVATVILLLKRPPVGFLGAWFFLILAPTSSFIPIQDPAFEHRMYLPLAAVVIGLGLLALEAHRRWLKPKLGPRWQRNVPLVAGGVLVVLLGALSALRNEVYRSPWAMWHDVAAKAPDNPRAYASIGWMRWQLKDIRGAIAAHQRAIALSEQRGRFLAGTDYLYHVQLGDFYLAAGDRPQAARHYRVALDNAQTKPQRFEATLSLGALLSQLGEAVEAETLLSQAAELKPGVADVRVVLGEHLARQGKHDQAARQFRKALQIDGSTNRDWVRRRLAECLAQANKIRPQ